MADKQIKLYLEQEEENLSMFDDGDVSDMERLGYIKGRISALQDVLKLESKQALELLTECWNQCLCDYEVDETEWNPDEHEGQLAELARDVGPFLEKAHNGKI